MQENLIFIKFVLSINVNKLPAHTNWIKNIRKALIQLCLTNNRDTFIDL